MVSPLKLPWSQSQVFHTLGLSFIGAAHGYLNWSSRVFSGLLTVGSALDCPFCVLGHTYNQGGHCNVTGIMWPVVLVDLQMIGR